ncbi:LLM class flavin-dependent oxidoreductase [Salipiger sp. IMCC34102]|uniref:LLM class flavin-dependent oxidoreductase n=1 Tax=Salipiger sp. IMCC34102 TaxID=2510647 RepID=UPI00101DFC07|nr:LLM class flavin-dependent oxidoreductase [Salipiger sp. IMCC34102]RYH02145.1 LLM class flavin-dependent oxidoreductase [Salipiger sp. IMCC34102]
MHHSILDLAPVTEGQTAAQAIANSVDLARTAEEAGYHRYWLAEHHNMPGIASAATSVLIGHIAAATRRIRVGAGGVMLPNHAPLAIAEQFGTLATIYPDRIDLGLGRAPGGDHAVMRAMRAGPRGDTFPNDTVELLSYFGEADPAAPVQAHPGQGTHVPVWILGSSLFGAQLAAHLGLPYAFASHFAPDALEDAVAVYRDTFRPSAYLDRPHFMLAVNAIVADTDAEAHYLRTSQQLAFARLRTGQPGKLPAPVRDLDATIGAGLRQGIDNALRISAVGSTSAVRARMSELIARYAPDEVILTGQIFDPEARQRSFTLAAEALSDLKIAA